MQQQQQQQKKKIFCSATSRRLTSPLNCSLNLPQLGSFEPPKVARHPMPYAPLG